jgi:uncharacterized protein YegL
MKIKAMTRYGRLHEGSAEPVDVLLEIKAPARPPSRSRPPVAVLPVLDVSGSMEGDKLAAARAALLRLVDHLGPGDHIGLVTFSSEARVVHPLVEVTQARRRTIRARIRALEAESSTNLGAGVVAAADLVAEARLPAGVRPRMIVLTDGHANEGSALTGPAIAALIADRASGLTVSAFGYGDDCDHELLGELAEARGGSYAYIRNPDVVLTAFGRELGGLMATYAAAVTIAVAAAGDEPVAVAVGDLLFGGEIGHYLRVDPVARRPASGVELAVVTVRWTGGDGAPAAASVPIRIDVVPREQDLGPEDPEVSRARDEHVLQLAQERAELLARQGDHAGAVADLTRVCGELRHADLIAFVRDHLVACYQDHDAHTRAAPLRSSARAALKKRRQVVASPEVEAAFALGRSAPELAMETSFRARPRRR